MILVAVIVGYILGSFPFILPKILDKKQEKVQYTERKEEDKSQAEILDEWLNGPKEKRGINQEDIYNEYITGQETGKGD